MLDGVVVHPGRPSRGTGGGAVPTWFHPIRNSGASPFEPFATALQDWIEKNPREMYNLYAGLIRTAELGQLHTALDAIIAIDKLSVTNEALLEGFEQYQIAGWDGAGAAPIGADDLKFARSLLREINRFAGPPDAAPGTDGSVCMEWINRSEHGGRVIYVDVGPGDRVLTLVQHGRGSPIEKHFAKHDPNVLGYLRHLFSVASP